jgi:RHS repeat-associated protein
MIRIRTAIAVCALGVAALAAAQEPPPDPLAAANAGDWTSGAYRYDGAGNIVQIGTTQTPNTEGRPNHYVYDLRGRLVEGTGNTAAQSNTQGYTYDVYGNLIKIITNGTNVVSIGVDAISNHIDKPTACAAGATCVTGTFDSAGNQISSSAGYTYKYDALSAMSELNGPQARHEAYLYDDLGERVAFVADGGTAQTWRYTLRGEDRRVWREYDDTVAGAQHSWSWVQDYVYRDGKLLASYKANGAGELAQHFHLDHLGSPRIITDDGGRRVATRTYMPYGEEAPGSSFDAEVMKFTGHERDIAPDGSVNSLDYMHARYYGAVQARFLTLDPSREGRSTSRPDSFNRYLYGGGSPIQFVDPTGEDIYYLIYTTGNRHGDPDFEQGALTRQHDIQSSPGFDPAKDIVLTVAVRTKAEFTKVLQPSPALEKKYGQVKELSLFSHSGVDGPSFHSPGASQFTLGEIYHLPQVNWAPNAAAYFWGCRTGWGFSLKFGEAEHVTSYGQRGWSSPSSRADMYAPMYPGGPVYFIVVDGLKNTAINPLSWHSKHDAVRLPYPMVPYHP